MVNWKVRLKHKTFWVAALSAVLVFANNIAAAFGHDITIVSEQITTVAESALGILVLLGIITDPTTSGISDSGRAMTYQKPKE